MLRIFSASAGFFLLCITGCRSPEAASPCGAVFIPVPASSEIAVEQHVNFTPSFQPNPSDKYPDAGAIYESSPKASQGVYISGGTVFVIVVIDTKKETLKYVDGTAMLRSDALLRRHYPQLPTTLGVDCQILEEELDDETGIYRYAVAYRESDIKEILIK